MTTDEFIDLNRNADVRKLALKKPPAGVGLSSALQQIEGWQLARRKLPTWAATPGIVFPPRLALEQCSSEATAQYKASVIAAWLAAGTSRRHSLCDLTGGFGVDFFALAPLFGEATYIDRQQDLVDAASHNQRCLAAAPEVTYRFICSDATDHLRQMPPVDVIFIDPARRDAAGRKVALIEDCQPDIAALHDDLMAKCRMCMVKLSPMLDIKAALRTLTATREVHVVSLDGECKEVVLLMQRHEAAAPAPPSPTVVCAMLRTGDATSQRFAFTYDEEAAAAVQYAASPGGFLMEPDAAILKAGAYKLTALRYGIRKLAANTHLYTADAPVAGFPGRQWRITAHASFAKRELRTLLDGVTTAEVAVRGFPASVATLRRQLRLPDGPDAHLIATTLADGSHRLLRVEPI